MSLPPSLVCRIAARKVQKVNALLSSFLCHPLKWNVEEERDRRERLVGLRENEGVRSIDLLALNSRRTVHCLL